MTDWRRADWSRDDAAVFVRTLSLADCVLLIRALAERAHAAGLPQADEHLTVAAEMIADAGGRTRVVV